MTDVKGNPHRGDGSGHSKKAASHFNTASSQRARIIPALIERKSQGLTTIQMRKPPLDILHPPARILELRRQGYRIETIWTHEATEAGQMHRVGRYVLIGLPTGGEFFGTIKKAETGVSSPVCAGV
jgi:Helix-turn-helix domain